MVHLLCWFMTKNRIKLDNQGNSKYTNFESIRFKTNVLRLNLCNFSDTYMVLKGSNNIICKYWCKIKNCTYPKN